MAQEGITHDKSWAWPRGMCCIKQKIRVGTQVSEERLFAD